jgi:hypothetical protein
VTFRRAKITTTKKCFRCLAPRLEEFLSSEAFIIRGNVCGAKNTFLGDTGRVCIKFGIVSINGIL